jgi:hypothetical protein
MDTRYPAIGEEDTDMNEWQYAIFEQLCTLNATLERIAIALEVQLLPEAEPLEIHPELILEDLRKRIDD